MMTHVLMCQYKESTERRKTSSLKEGAENVDQRKAILKKTMTTQEKCMKWDFVAPLKAISSVKIKIFEALFWNIYQPWLFHSY